MFKKSNSGFTLLELLISICILTTVIFIGYKVIDKATIDIKNQGNINKGQLTMNDMNEYLTKDLEQAKSVALFLNGEKIADTIVEENDSEEEKQNILSDKIRDLENELNKLSIGNKFDYSYAIRFKNDENNTYSIKYKVEITKSNHDYKYSISREENNGINISFINEALLKEKELPFLIEGNSPYKVTLGYTSKDNSFTKHEFTITYRLNNIITTNTTNPPENEVVPPQVDDDLDGDLIFEFIRNDSLSSNSNETMLNKIVKSKDENGEYKEIFNSSQITNKGQLSSASLLFTINKKSNRLKDNGEYVLNQIYDTDNNIHFQLRLHGDLAKEIKNYEIYKDIRNIGGILFKFDKNIDSFKITRTEHCNLIKSSDDEIEIRLKEFTEDENQFPDRYQPPKIDIQYDISKYDDTNKIGDEAYFKVSVTFIEDKQ